VKLSKGTPMPDENEQTWGDKGLEPNAPHCALLYPAAVTGGYKGFLRAPSIHSRTDHVITEWLLAATASNLTSSFALLPSDPM
jgi:hypothetical protein